MLTPVILIKRIPLSYAAGEFIRENQVTQILGSFVLNPFNAVFPSYLFYLSTGVITFRTGGVWFDKLTMNPRYSS